MFFDLIQSSVKDGRPVWPMLFCLFFALQNTPLFGQRAQELVDVEHFSIEQGLINRDLNTCSIDQKGFIWAASRNGISRFDGVDFKNYKLTSTPFTVGWYSGFQIDVNGKVWLYPMIDCKTVKLVDPETDIQQPFDDYFSGKCPFKAHEIYQIMPGQRRPYVFYIALESGRLFEYNGRFNEITVPDGYNILSESFNFSGC